MAWSWYRVFLIPQPANWNHQVLQNSAWNMSKQIIDWIRWSLVSFEIRLVKIFLIIHNTFRHTWLALCHVMLQYNCLCACANCASTHFHIHITTFKQTINLLITCCSNCISIPDLTPDLNGLVKDNCKTGRDISKFWNLVRLNLEVWRQSVLSIVVQWCYPPPLAIWCLMVSRH